MTTIYVHYSGATDKTGMAIANELKAEHGTELPKKRYDIYIGWGAKTDKDGVINADHIFNGPNAIRKNRNKFEALKMMKDGNVTVCQFVTAESVQTHLKNDTIKLPLIGRTNFHQGGKNFWLCLAKTHVTKAIAEGAQYFQRYIPLVTEYRMHIFNDAVFYAGKKEQHENPQQVFVDEFIEKTKASAAKANKAYDEETAKYVLNNFAERKQHSNPILKSHSEGWKFTKVENKELSTKEVKALCEESIKAVKAIGLSFGAVDCAIDEDNKPYVIEVNSGPGLTGVTFTKWIEEFKKTIIQIETKKAEEEAKAKAKTTTKTATVKVEPVVAKKSSKVEVGAGFSKGKVINQLDYITELLKFSNTDTEAKTIMSVAARVLNNVEAAAGANLFE